MTATAQAVAAVIAAKHYRQWGEYASFRYAERRGVPVKTYLIALRVEMQRKARSQ